MGLRNDFAKNAGLLNQNWLSLLKPAATEQAMNDDITVSAMQLNWNGRC
jgi:hypothetical protein